MEKNQQELQTQHFWWILWGIPRSLLCEVPASSVEPGETRPFTKRQALKSETVANGCERFALACSLDAETDGAESWKFPSIHKIKKKHTLAIVVYEKKLDTFKKHASISFGKMLLMAHEINYLINAWWLDRMFYCAVLHPEFRLQSLAGQIWHAMFLNRPESTDPSAACKIQNE